MNDYAFLAAGLFLLCFNCIGCWVRNEHCCLIFYVISIKYKGDEYIYKYNY